MRNIYINALSQERMLSKTKADKNCLYFKSLKKLFKNMKLLSFASVVSFVNSAKSLPAGQAGAEVHNSFIGGRRRINGQSTVEYAVLIGCIALALMTMYGYLKRGIQGKMRESADQIGEQYEPGNTVSDFTVHSMSSVTTVSDMTIDDNDNTNATTVTTTNYDIQQRVGTETVGAF